MYQRLRDRLFDYQSAGSFVNELRRRRAARFHALLETLPGDAPVEILDVGGTLTYWEQTGLPDPRRYRITMLNKHAETVPKGTPHICNRVGDCRAMDFADGQFDVVFSNSVIEHMGSREGQVRMAKEIRRVGRRYVVQTPSLWFPLEPHCHLPFFQFLPRQVRAALIWRFRIRGFPSRPAYRDCLTVSDSVILLSRRGFAALFPEARIWTERLAGLAKSYTAIAGWTECHDLRRD